MKLTVTVKKQVKQVKNTFTAYFTDLIIHFVNHFLKSAFGISNGSPHEPKANGILQYMF